MFKSNRERILFFVLAIVGVMLTLGINNALANPFDTGQCWFDAYFDVRTYDQSHPGYEKIANPGGWTVGVGCLAPRPANFDKLYYENADGANIKVHGEINILQSQNYGCAPWGNNTICDWTIRYGSYWYVGDWMYVGVYDDQGEDDVLLYDKVLPLPRNLDRPPFCTVEKMAIKKDGELKFEFKAPYDTRNNQVRVRVFDEAGTTMVYEVKINPPYPKKVELLIPSEYQGRTGRIEYRVFDELGDPYWMTYMSRGVTMFKLPELE